MSPRVLYLVLTCASCSFALPTAPDPDAGALPPQPGDPSPRCAGYTAAGGSTYRRVTTPLAWLDSEQACEADESGATHLAIVDSMTELDAIRPLLGSATWIGLADRRVEGTWRWVDGATQAPMGPPWKIGEPSHGGEDNCGLVDMAAHFDAVNCNDAKPYLCECDGVAPVASSY